MAKLEDLRDLLHHEVQAMFSAEKAIEAGLPRLIEHASSKELQNAFKKHLNETTSQIARLKQVADLLEIDPEGDGNPGMKGIIAEGEKVMNLDSTPEALDAALICGAQKVEHYEIAGYGTAVYLAQELGLESVARILDGILDEEKNTNEALSHLAKNLINVRAE